MPFSPDELHTIACALRVAAEQYNRDAVTAQENFTVLGGVAIARVAQQFERQARAALELAERIEQRPDHGSELLLPLEDRELGDEPDAGCTNPGGHVWNRTAGEADEARLAGDHESDNIRCVYCGADGDA